MDIKQYLFEQLVYEERRLTRMHATFNSRYIGTTHASHCHRAAAYERPACLAAKAAPAKASGAYPEYLMRKIGGAWVQTL